ncbi:MAG: DHHA1 domain-containing protein, partial [Nitriliruptoraceae bacterium]
VPSGASIGTITVVREESVGSNTRRVEALTGTDALAHLARERLVAEEVARLVEAPTDEAVGRVEELIRRLRAAEKQAAALRGASLSQQARELATESAPVDGLTVIARRIDGTTMDELRQLATETRGHLTGRGVVIVGAAGDDGKAQMIAAVTTEVVEAGVEAREVLQPAAELVAGGAGGRGDLAQAGGRDGSRLDEALQLAASRARTVIG